MAGQDDDDCICNLEYQVTDSPSIAELCPATLEAGEQIRFDDGYIIFGPKLCPAVTSLMSPTPTTSAIAGVASGDAAIQNQHRFFIKLATGGQYFDAGRGDMVFCSTAATYALTDDGRLTNSTDSNSAFSIDIGDTSTPLVLSKPPRDIQMRWEFRGRELLWFHPDLPDDPAVFCQLDDYVVAYFFDVPYDCDRTDLIARDTDSCTGYPVEPDTKQSMSSVSRLEATMLGRATSVQTMSSSRTTPMKSNLTSAAASFSSLFNLGEPSPLSSFQSRSLKGSKKSGSVDLSTIGVSMPWSTSVTPMTPKSELHVSTTATTDWATTRLLTAGFGTLYLSTSSLALALPYSVSDQTIGIIAASTLEPHWITLIGTVRSRKRTSPTSVRVNVRGSQSTSRYMDESNLSVINRTRTYTGFPRPLPQSSRRTMTTPSSFAMTSLSSPRLALLNSSRRARSTGKVTSKGANLSHPLAQSSRYASSFPTNTRSDQHTSDPPLSEIWKPELISMAQTYFAATMYQSTPATILGLETIAMKTVTAQSEDLISLPQQTSVEPLPAISRSTMISTAQMTIGAIMNACTSSTILDLSTVLIETPTSNDQSSSNPRQWLSHLVLPPSSGSTMTSVWRMNTGMNTEMIMNQSTSSTKLRLSRIDMNSRNARDSSVTPVLFQPQVPYITSLDNSCWDSLASSSIPSDCDTKATTILTSYSRAMATGLADVSSSSENFDDGEVSQSTVVSCGSARVSGSSHPTASSNISDDSVYGRNPVIGAHTIDDKFSTWRVPTQSEPPTTLLLPDCDIFRTNSGDPLNPVSHTSWSFVGNSGAAATISRENQPKSSLSGSGMPVSLTSRGAPRSTSKLLSVISRVANSTWRDDSNVRYTYVSESTPENAFAKITIFPMSMLPGQSTPSILSSTIPVPKFVSTPTSSSDNLNVSLVVVASSSGVSHDTNSSALLIVSRTHNVTTLDLPEDAATSTIFTSSNMQTLTDELYVGLDNTSTFLDTTYIVSAVETTKIDSQPPFTDESTTTATSDLPAHSITMSSLYESVDTPTMTEFTMDSVEDTSTTATRAIPPSSKISRSAETGLDVESTAMYPSSSISSAAGIVSDPYLTSIGLKSYSELPKTIFEISTIKAETASSDVESETSLSPAYTMVTSNAVSLSDNPSIASTEVQEETTDPISSAVLSASTTSFTSTSNTLTSSAIMSATAPATRFSPSQESFTLSAEISVTTSSSSTHFNTASADNFGTTFSPFSYLEASPAESSTAISTTIEPVSSSSPISQRTDIVSAVPMSNSRLAISDSSAAEYAHSTDTGSTSSIIPTAIGSLQLFCSDYLGYVTSTLTSTVTIVKSSALTSYKTTTTTLTSMTTIAGTTTKTVYQTIPSTTATITSTYTQVIYSLSATSTRMLLKRDMPPSMSVPIATPTELNGFLPAAISAICSVEATAVSLVSTLTQNVTVAIIYATTTTQTLSKYTTSTDLESSISYATITVANGPAITSNPTVTTTSTSTITTTITIASGAPIEANNPQFMAISNPNDPGAAYAYFDSAHHLTDNYFHRDVRDVFALTTENQLYDVTDDSWYYTVALQGNTDAGGLLYWDSNMLLASKNFDSQALRDGTGRTQLFVTDATTIPPTRQQFCLAVVGSDDYNPTGGYHIRWYNPAVRPGIANCSDVNIYLSPIVNG